MDQKLTIKQWLLAVFVVLLGLYVLNIIVHFPSSLGSRKNLRPANTKVTEVAFENYDPVKGQAEFRAKQARDKQRGIERDKAAAHRRRIWTWVKWVVGLSFIALLVIWEIRLRRAGWQPPAPAP